MRVLYCKKNKGDIRGEGKKKAKSPVVYFDMYIECFFHVESTFLLIFLGTISIVTKFWNWTVRFECY